MTPLTDSEREGARVLAFLMDSEPMTPEEVMNALRFEIDEREAQKAIAELVEMKRASLGWDGKLRTWNGSDLYYSKGRAND